MTHVTFTASLAALLLDVFWKSLPVFALAGGASLLLRRASAAARHALWLLVLAGLLCLPAFCALLPRWAAPVLPAAAPRRDASDPSVPREQARVVTPPDVPPAQTAPASVIPDAAGPAVSETPLAPPPAVVSPTVRPPMPARPVTAADWACLAWLGGVLLVLGRTVIGLAAAWRLVRRCRPVTAGPLWEATEGARRALGLTRPLAVCVGDVAVPMTCGVTRPVVLLPEGAVDWPEGRLRAVLLHEAAHVRRLDWATMVLARCVCALYWAHPLAWLVAHRLRAEAEGACDDLVLTSGGIPAPDYAAHLLEIVRALSSHRAPSVATVAMASRPEVSSRLRTILDAQKVRSNVTRRGLALAAVTALALLAPLASIHPVTAASRMPPNDTPSREWLNTAEMTTKSDHGLQWLNPWQKSLLASERSPWKVTLPDGIQVMLADVWALNGVTADKQWTPGGTLLQDFGGPAPPFYSHFHDTVCNIGLLLDFPTQTMKTGARVSFAKSGERPGGGTDLAQFQVGRNRMIFHNLPLVRMGYQDRFAPSLDRTDLVVHVAAGPETVLISGSPQTGATCRLAIGETASVSAASTLPVTSNGGNGTETIARFIFTLPSHFVRDQSEYKISLIGTDEKPLDAPNGSQSYPSISHGEAHITYTYHTTRLPLSRVSAIRMTYRPAYTAVFRNVALRPAAASALAPLLTPAFTPLNTAKPAGAGPVQTVSYTVTAQHFDAQGQRDQSRGPYLMLGAFPPQVGPYPMQVYVRRDPPAVAKMSHLLGWKYLDDTRGSFTRTERGDYVVRRLSPTQDGRGFVSGEVSADLRACTDAVGPSLSDSIATVTPWRERSVTFGGRSVRLFSRDERFNFIKPAQSSLVQEWVDSATGRLLRVESATIPSHAPEGREVVTESDFQYNQPPPPDVFDWSPPSGAKVTDPREKPARVRPAARTKPDDQARFLAGLTAVQGPGVVVTLNDSRRRVARNMQIPGVAPPNLIHDTDINQFVNELKAAGAEAIAVNGERLEAVSPIRSAGVTVLVNSTALTPPYIIRAIGNPAIMQATLNQPGGVAEQIRTFDPAMIRGQTSPKLTLPAYRGGISSRYARPVATRADWVAIPRASLAVARMANFPPRPIEPAMRIVKPPIGSQFSGLSVAPPKNVRLSGADGTPQVKPR